MPFTDTTLCSLLQVMISVDFGAGVSIVFDFLMHQRSISLVVRCASGVSRAFGASASTVCCVAASQPAGGVLQPSANVCGAARPGQRHTVVPPESSSPLGLCMGMLGGEAGSLSAHASEKLYPIHAHEQQISPLNTTAVELGYLLVHAMHAFLSIAIDRPHCSTVTYNPGRISYLHSDMTDSTWHLGGAFARILSELRF
ncbi:hypothetical protein BJV74DRAFT_795426 [Russula compacta]|nr:hypothetical protein BJV74DRAFT_795426 [Russula compacta]